MKSQNPRNTYKIFTFLSFSVVLFLALIVNTVYVYIAHADSVTTAVTVGNSAPMFTAGPAESTESSSSTPTNVGVGVTFQATATDGNGEDYYLVRV